MFDFPADPVNGSQYITPNGITFVYNGYAWIMKSGPWGSYGISLLDHGPGLVIVPDPITDTGTISLEIPVSVANGGTGAIDQAGARTNLGVVNRAGDVMTGSLEIRTTNPALIVTKSASGAQSIIFGNTGANARWAISLGDSGAETGSNNGSGFGVHRYADNGSYLGQVLGINRATGNAAFSNDLTVSGQLIASGGTTFNSIITMPNATYIRWRDTAGTPIELLTLFSDNQFYVGSYTTHVLVLRGGSITMNGQVTGNGEIRATTALRCIGNPNAIITFTQRDNYGIDWGFYAYGNTARWWNNQYGDRLTLDIGGTVYFTNNVVIPNNCWLYFKNTAGANYNIIGLDASNNVTLGHGSFNTYIAGASARSHPSFSAPYVSADVEVYASRSCAAASYFWVNGIQLSNNSGRFYSGSPFWTSSDCFVDGRVVTPRLDIYGGVFYNGYSDGWLYFNGSLRVANFNSQGDVTANGNFGTSNKYYMANGHYLQYWNGYTDTGQPFHCGAQIVAEGSLTSNNGLLYLAGMYWQNNGGWMYCPWGVRSDGNLRSNNDLECQNVFRNPWARGGKMETMGWEWDWITWFYSANSMYFSPDKSGAMVVHADDWWSDNRLKTAIKNSEIDALGLIIATPVRSWEWNERGAKLNNSYGAHRENTIGLVAQELQQTIPLAVRKHAIEEEFMLDWNYIHPYVFRAIQQLAELNAKLEARIAELEAR